MKPRKYPTKRQTTPPANLMEGVDRTMSAVVKIFDRKDGTGADWAFMADCLFKVAFAALNKLPADARRMLATTVHEKAYDYLVAASAPKQPDRREPLSSPTNVPTMRGPK